jgi:glutamate:GABA antiporter
MVTITYVLIFPAVIKLRYKYPNIDRPYKIPGGMIGLWVAGILTTAWALLTTIAIIYPGIGTSDPNASLPSGFAGQRLQYTLSQVIPLAVMVLIGLAFYAAGAPTRRQARLAAATAGVTTQVQGVPVADTPSASTGQVETGTTGEAPAGDG